MGVLWGGGEGNGLGGLGLGMSIGDIFYDYVTRRRLPASRLDY